MTVVTVGEETTEVDRMKTGRKRKGEVTRLEYVMTSTRSDGGAYKEWHVEQYHYTQTD